VTAYNELYHALIVLPSLLIRTWRESLSLFGCDSVISWPCTNFKDPQDPGEFPDHPQGDGASQWIPHDSEKPDRHLPGSACSGSGASCRVGLAIRCWSPFSYSGDTENWGETHSFIFCHQRTKIMVLVRSGFNHVAVAIRVPVETSVKSLTLFFTATGVHFSLINISLYVG